MTKNHDRNGFFVLGGLKTQLHDILWAVHDGKNRGRSEGEENIGVFPVTVGGRGRAMHRGLPVSIIHVRACVRGIGLYLNPSDCTAGYALLNPSDRSMVVN